MDRHSSHDSEARDALIEGLLGSLDVINANGANGIHPEIFAKHLPSMLALDAYLRVVASANWTESRPAFAALAAGIPQLPMLTRQKMLSVFPGQYCAGIEQMQIEQVDKLNAYMNKKGGERLGLLHGHAKETGSMISRVLSRIAGRVRTVLGMREMSDRA